MVGYIHTAAVPILVICPPACDTGLRYPVHCAILCFHFFFGNKSQPYICSISDAMQLQSELSHRKSCGFYHLSLWDNSLSIWPGKTRKATPACSQWRNNNRTTLISLFRNDSVMSSTGDVVLQLHLCLKQVGNIGGLRQILLICTYSCSFCTDIVIGQF